MHRRYPFFQSTTMMLFQLVDKCPMCGELAIGRMECNSEEYVALKGLCGKCGERLKCEKCGNSFDSITYGYRIVKEI